MPFTIDWVIYEINSPAGPPTKDAPRILSLPFSQWTLYIPMFDSHVALSHLSKYFVYVSYWMPFFLSNISFLPTEDNSGSVYIQ